MRNASAVLLIFHFTLFLGCGDDDAALDASVMDGGALDAWTDSEAEDSATIDAEIDALTDAPIEDASLADSASEDASLDASMDAPVSPGCLRDSSGGRRRILVDGLERVFQVDVPEEHEGPLPVVFNFHGRTSNGDQQRTFSGMSELADREGFLVAYAEGIGATWNGGLCCGEARARDIDDIAFVEAMLTDLEASFCIDPQRIYATGLSNGGILSHRIACELSDRFAAIATVAGHNMFPGCEPGRPMPVLHFHGDADLVVQYRGLIGAYPPVVEGMEDWAERNGCGAGREERARIEEVLCETWSGCEAETELCTVEGGGHQWFGGESIPGLGANTDSINASEMIWRFFERHRLE